MIYSVLTGLCLLMVNVTCLCIFVHSEPEKHRTISSTNNSCVSCSILKIIFLYI